MLGFVASTKVRMINVRLRPETHDEFKIACELRGGSMSSILHQFIIRTIRDEKESDPRAFKTALSSNVALDKSKGVHLQTIGELSNERPRLKKRAK